MNENNLRNKQNSHKFDKIHKHNVQSQVKDYFNILSLTSQFLYINHLLEAIIII